MVNFTAPLRWHENSVYCSLPRRTLYGAVKRVLRVREFSRTSAATRRRESVVARKLTSLFTGTDAERGIGQRKQTVFILFNKVIIVTSFLVPVGKGRNGTGKE